MKKVVSILLLVVFLFNVGGYYLAYWALQYRTNEKLSVLIDHNHYGDAETVTIKIPLNLPYPIQEQEYERVDGNFEYNGEYYKLVKQRLKGDALYVVCLKNEDQTLGAKTIADYVKMANDLPGNAKKALGFFGKLLKDFNYSTIADRPQTAAWVAEITFDESCFSIKEANISILAPPPRA